MRSKTCAPDALPVDEAPETAFRSPGRHMRRFWIFLLTLFVAVGISVIVYLLFFFLPSMNRHQAARMIAPSIRAAQVGGAVYLGAYEQDNVESNGEEPIEWVVLDKRDDRCLLMSRYGLDSIPFNDAETFVTWGTSGILDWLNNTFYYEAFNTTERTMLLASEQLIDTNPYFKTDAGSVTHEKLFLANIAEAVEYLPDESNRQCEPTAYAIARGVEPSKLNGCCLWWLRTPGFDGSVFTRVLSDGRINFSGYRIQSRREAVRPFVWVTFDPTADHD